MDTFREDKILTQKYTLKQNKKRGRYVSRD